MKPRVEGRVACIKMRVRLQPLQRYNYFPNHQTKNRKKSLIAAKIWKTIQKDPKMHHKEGSNVPTDENMITQHIVTKTKLFC